MARTREWQDDLRSTAGAWGHINHDAMQGPRGYVSFGRKVKTPYDEEFADHFEGEPELGSMHDPYWHALGELRQGEH